MHAQKVTISISQELYEFIEAYQKRHHVKKRSEVIHIALKLLEENQLEYFYAQANKELNQDFDNTIADGLDDETW